MTDASAARQVREIFDRLFAAYGPQHWWPAKTPLEVVVGAILTQNTAWRNVERAIANLRDAGLLDWTALRDVPDARLSDLIRPAGTYRVKTARLRAFIDALWSENNNGSLDRLLGGSLEHARVRLLGIHGIGPETADAILLYAAGRTSFVVDAYTQRLLRRHFLIEPGTGYNEVRAFFHEVLPADPPLFNEFHALIVEVGKRHCGARARCDDCPLAGLPHDPELV